MGGAGARLEDERLRDGRIAAEEGIDEQLVGVAELVLNVEAPDEVGHLGLILLAADVEADDLEPLRPVLLLEADEVRNLLAAGRAVGGPEVEHDDLPAQVFEPHAPSVRLYPCAGRALARGDAARATSDSGPRQSCGAGLE